MAWAPLKENYTDAAWEGLKKYVQVENEDDTVSFRDVTQYSNRENSFFGALDANRITAAINVIMAMVENGTDLYTDFQSYFATQQTLFEQTADSKQTAFTTYLNGIEADADTMLSNLETNSTRILNELETNSTATYNGLVTYVDGLKTQADAIIATIETNYSAEIAQFEDTQEQVFTVWFQSIRDQMSGDVATNLINRLNATDEEVFNNLYGLCTKTTTIQTVNDSKVITETDTGRLVVATTTISAVAAGKQIVTVVVPESGSYQYTKTTLIADDNGGKRITESYVKEGKQ